MAWKAKWKPPHLLIYKNSKAKAIQQVLEITFYQYHFVMLMTKNNQFWLGKPCMWSLHVFSHVSMGCLWILQFPPVSQNCAHEVSWHV